MATFLTVLLLALAAAAVLALACWVWSQWFDGSLLGWLMADWCTRPLIDLFVALCVMIGEALNGRD